MYNDNGGNWNNWTGGGGAAGSWDTLSGGPVSTDTWTHLAITYDARRNTKSFYVDGFPTFNTLGLIYSPNGTVQSEDLHIGSGADSGGAFFFSGNIDDVSIWDTVLSREAIVNIKDNGVASAIPEPTSLGLLALGCLALVRRRRS